MKPIPPGPPLDFAVVRSIPIRECGEPLVPASLVPERILVRPQYHVAGLPHALPECFLREVVLERLLAAARALPDRLRLLLLDAWRPVALQRWLFSSFVWSLREQHPDADEADLNARAERYVAMPSEDPSRPPWHLTGGAVDVTLVSDAGRMVEMGTAFDEMSAMAATRALEELSKDRKELTAGQKEALENRRVLYHAMTSAGFVNLSSEWWHYDFGDQLWAWRTGEEAALYGGVAPRLPWGLEFRSLTDDGA